MSDAGFGATRSVHPVTSTVAVSSTSTPTWRWPTTKSQSRMRTETGLLVPTPRTLRQLEARDVPAPHCSDTDSTVTRLHSSILSAPFRPGRSGETPATPATTARSRITTSSQFRKASATSRPGATTRLAAPAPEMTRVPLPTTVTGSVTTNSPGRKQMRALASSGSASSGACQFSPGERTSVAHPSPPFAQRMSSACWTVRAPASGAQSPGT